MSWGVGVWRHTQEDAGGVKLAPAEANDSLGVSLDHTAALITEKRSIFARNDAVVKQVVGAAPWSACLALPRRLVPYALAAAAAAAAAAAVWIWRVLHDRCRTSKWSRPTARWRPSVTASVVSL
jgi:hypothetical protein